MSEISAERRGSGRPMVGTLSSKCFGIFHAKDLRLADECNHDSLVHQQQTLKHFLETFLGRHFPMHLALVAVLLRMGMSFVLEFRLPFTPFPVQIDLSNCKGKNASHQLIRFLIRHLGDNGAYLLDRGMRGSMICMQGRGLKWEER